MKFCSTCQEHTEHKWVDDKGNQCQKCKLFNIFLDKKYIQEHYGQKVR